METRKDNDKRDTSLKAQGLGQYTTVPTNLNSPVQDEDSDEGSKDDTGNDTQSSQGDRRGKKSQYRSLTASDDSVSLAHSGSAPNSPRSRIPLGPYSRRVLALLLKTMRKATEQLFSRDSSDDEEEDSSCTESDEDEDESMDVDSTPSPSDLESFYASDVFRSAEAAVDQSVDAMEDIFMSVPTQPEPEQAAYMPDGYMKPSWFEFRYRK